MTITKTDFAKLMGVDKSQVTYWCTRGMPVDAAGKVEPVEAATWVRENIDAAQWNTRSKGAAQLRSSEVARWEKSLATAYALDADYAAKYAAEALRSLLAPEQIREVAKHILKKLRFDAVDALQNDFVRPPAGCKTWADAPAFRGDGPKSFSWEELLHGDANASAAAT